MWRCPSVPLRLEVREGLVGVRSMRDGPPPTLGVPPAPSLGSVGKGRDKEGSRTPRGGCSARRNPCDSPRALIDSSFDRRVPPRP